MHINATQGKLNVFCGGGYRHSYKIKVKKKESRVSTRNTRDAVSDVKNISRARLCSVIRLLFKENSKFNSTAKFCAQSKGQLISKENCGVFNSSKKRMQKFCPSRLGQKLKILVRFLEELMTANFPFEIN